MTARILVFHGRGKGKTTAAAGMAARALGHGKSVDFIQFLKSRASGEISALRALGAWTHTAGKGFVPPADTPHYAEHRQAAQEAWKTLCDRSLTPDAAEFLFLDEVLGAIQKKLIDLQDLLDFIEFSSTRGAVVLTGRVCPPEIAALADTITRCECEKHGYAHGLAARQGVEW